MGKKIKDPEQKIEMINRTTLSKEILNKMVEDSTQALVTFSLPIYYWTQAQQYENNAAKLKKLARSYIKTKLSNDDIYDHKIGRYALLIYQIILNNGKLDKLANNLFKITVNG
ncbi:MAG: hypothetical protein IPH58_13800 [Sphingobacteriales bacterium]|nr:hypothetical protein [Sphingobacteriales bacterium]